MGIIQRLMMAIGLIMGSLTWAQESPVPMLEQSAKQILATLKQHKVALKSNPGVVYQAVERYLLPNVDVMGMSHSVLGHQVWSKASPQKRQQFSQAFTKLVIRTYANPLTEYTNETIRFLPIRGSVDGRFVRVSSVITRPGGQKIPLNYSLVSKQGVWKIYDLNVEGVSLLQSFRSQFAEALRHSNIEDIIQQLQHQSSKKVA